MKQNLQLPSATLFINLQFIQVATGHEEGVGHGLQRCTNEITPVQVGFAPHIVLVDTPGFDDVDDSGSDQIILTKLSEWLQKTCGFSYAFVTSM